ncbi:MAG: guanylate kinase [Hyphomicrobiaceae bacterium]|nr:guanylate kinase [Hyphomicrobiaceae bacterium]
MSDQQAAPTRLNIRRRGLVLILASPSGAGKSTISRQLVQEFPSVKLSVSVTTRQRRPSEIDGKHYHFISKDRFTRLRDGGELLEYAEVHGNNYATPLEPVEAALDRGDDMLFDIDWQGTMQVYEKLRTPERNDVASIFILPPSMAELRSRLERRAEDKPEVIARRLVNARTEIAQWEKFDYVIVNDDLDGAYQEVRSILLAERLKRARRVGLNPLVDDLLGTTL